LSGSAHSLQRRIQLSYELLVPGKIRALRPDLANMQGLAAFVTA
jgi:hypothetical protein